MTRGVRKGPALTFDQEQYIRELYRTGWLTRSELAKKYEVSITVINRIVKWVKPGEN